MLKRFVAALLATTAPAAAASVQNFVIDPAPPAAPLEKSIGYYTSTTFPSAIIGAAENGGPGGYYLYRATSGFNGPWVRTVIDPTGDAYERIRPFTWPGDTYPGFMASRSGQLVWYYNPLNWGGDPGDPNQWGYQVINPNAGCHDMRIVDVEQSGFPAVVCSATYYGGTTDFIAFNNGVFDSWTIRNNPFNVNGLGIGDFVAPLSVSKSPAYNFVGATTGGIYWFRNPRMVGGNPRTAPWTPFLIGGVCPGSASACAAVGETAIMNTPYGQATDGVIAASSEEPYGPWPPGLVWYSPNSNPQSTWTAHQLDSTYRAVHEINSGILSNGVPYFVAAEQEQAGGTASCAAEHPGIPSRVTLFEYTSGAFQPSLELSIEGTQSQQTVTYGNQLVVAGANHGFCNTPYRAFQGWVVSP